MTNDEPTPTRQKVRTAAKLLAMCAGLAYGLSNIPPAIEGIWFVQVLPALVLGGLAGLVVDAIGLVLAPRDDEQDWVKLHMAALVIVVALTIMKPFVRARERVREVIR